MCTVGPIYYAPPVLGVLPFPGNHGWFSEAKVASKYLEPRDESFCDGWRIPTVSRGIQRVTNNQTRLMLHASRTCTYALCPTVQSTGYTLTLQQAPGEDAVMAQVPPPPKCDLSYRRNPRVCPVFWGFLTITGDHSK